MFFALLLPYADKLESLMSWFIAFGPVGAFLISLLDSFIPLPGGADFAVIALSSKAPTMTPVTVLAATAGAVIGSTVLYLGARRAGAAALSRVSPERRERIENLLGRYDVLSIAVAATLPPPFPFKAFNLTAGVLKIHWLRFVIAVAIGRLFRFSLEAVLAVQFGSEAIDIIKRHGLKVLIVVALVALGVWVYRRFVMRPVVAAEE